MSNPDGSMQYDSMTPAQFKAHLYEKIDNLVLDTRGTQPTQDALDYIEALHEIIAVIDAGGDVPYICNQFDEPCLLDSPEGDETDTDVAGEQGSASYVDWINGGSR